MRVRGTVVTRPFGRGSKSERTGVFIDTDGGESFLLQRDEGNRFRDPVLVALVGKRIEADGVKESYAFFLRKWREL